MLSRTRSVRSEKVACTFSNRWWRSFPARSVKNAMNGMGTSARSVSLTFRASMKPTIASPRTSASMSATTPMPEAMRTASMSFVACAMRSPVFVTAK